MKNFDYIQVNSDFKPKNYVSFTYFKIPSLIVRDLNRVLSKYSLPNTCQPNMTHMLHGLIRYFLINGQRRNHIYFNDEDVYRTRSFNVNKNVISYLPDEQNELEELFSELFSNRLDIY